ncbi:major capsid protein [Aneurinibacillus aneurinilyticus]|uniref:major capsid protein n=1 Tax=Aneurinibacillus aneurinilyticus TaxID=1391 RepID=UPI0023F03CA1|nr:major capsid protein [Aneurinibacillus aneurinilyticus]
MPTILTLEEFQQPTLLSYVESITVPFESMLERFLPKDDPSWSLDFTYDIVSGVSGTAAAIIPFGAPAPLRDKKVPKNVLQEVAKIAHNHHFTQREQLTILNARNEKERQKVIDKALGHVDSLKLGVMKTEEWMRAGALYRGKLEIKDDKGGVIAEIVFDIPAANKITLTGADTWNNYASAKPLQDLIDAGIKFKKANAGRAPQEIHISMSAFYDILHCQHTISSIKGTAGGAVTMDEINAYMKKFGLPELTMNDEEIDFEETATTERFLPERRVAMLGISGFPTLGSTVEGPTVENQGEPGIYVSTWKEQSTKNEFIEVGKAAFPALRRPTGILHLDV